MVWTRPVTIVFHSPCSDGVAAAFVLYEWLNACRPPTGQLNLVPAKAGSSVAITREIADAFVIIVDMVPSNVQAVVSAAYSIAILDHHVTNAAVLQDISRESADSCVSETLKGPVGVTFCKDLSGVGMAWAFAHASAADDGAAGVPPLPRALQYIQERDLWRFSSQESQDFSTGLYSMMDVSAGKELQAFELLRRCVALDSDAYLDQVRFHGQQLEKAKEQQLEQYLTTGSKVYVNAPSGRLCAYIAFAPWHASSDLGNFIMTRPGLDVDFTIVAYLTKARESVSDTPFTFGWQYSLRSTDAKADVGAFATYLKATKGVSGGGHRNAAGMSSTLGPFELFDAVIA